MKKSDNKRPSESFILGLVALVFLIIGYQTAMFVYKAAVMRIEANRDEPDTVYVYGAAAPEVLNRYSSETVMGKDRNEAIRGAAAGNVCMVRREAAHSPRVEAMRQSLPRRKVEAFRFNPNTVTEDELCRLGFSRKQAQSIVNYRE
jgi:hypothetical protein